MMPENRTNLLRHFRVVWPVARRELLSTVTTKGYWFVTLSLAFAWAILFGFVWSISWVYKKVAEENPELATLISAEGYEEIIDALRYESSFFFWGDQLHYYIVDQTGQEFDEAIRNEIVQQDFEVYLDTLPDRVKPPTIEQFEKEWFDESVEMYPPPSYRKFVELQEPDINIERLSEHLENGEIDGYFLIPETFVDFQEGAKFFRPRITTEAHANKLRELEVWLEGIFTTVLRDFHLAHQYVDDAELRTKLFHPLRTKVEEVSSPTSEMQGDPTDTHNDSVTVPIAHWLKFASIPFILLFNAALVQASNLVLLNTVEEKSNKAAEMLLSRLAPTAIMDGKVLGSGLTILVGVAVFAVLVGPPLVLTLQSVLDPTDFSNVLHPFKIFNWLLFLTLGLFFFGYIQSALGSLCDDMKDGTVVLFPMILVQILGVWPSVVFVLFDPGGILARILSFVPIVSPYVMVSRTAALPDWPVYLAIVLVLCLSVYLVRRFTSTIYSYGLAADRVPKRYGRIIQAVRQGT